MARRKVKLAYITNDSARKATFKKRKKGLMKKMSELSTLCGIDACAIVYSPYDTKPEVFPSTLGVQRVLTKFKKMPEMEQNKKMVNQDSFLRQRIVKANDQLKKQMKDNREKQMIRVMFQGLTGKSLQGLSIVDLNDLGWLVDQKLKEIYWMIESTKKRGAKQGKAQAGEAADGTPRSGREKGVAAVQVPVAERVGPSDMNMANMSKPQWLVDLMINHAGHGGFGAEVMIPPGFDGKNHRSVWPNGFFP
ncbi:hypothetical protein UlMin_030664 [Ulmus minor]